MQHEISTQAQKDINEIVYYIRRDSPVAAICQKDKFMQSDLSKVKGNYIIFNLIEDFINIVRVLHMSRNFSENQLT
jgi:plasmid stabilization system protein ParE